MQATPQTFNQFWAQLVVEELVRQGVTMFCMASGARCTPLTLAVARHPHTESVIHFDERGCAFHALGWSRATGRPSAVVTTSGTAVANLVPAATEAAQEGIPLLLLTADRPPELRDAGANQAIDQIKFFGALARWFCDLPCPTREVPPGYVLTTVAQAVRRSLAPDPGPVHLNVMFRDPLAPEFTGDDLTASVASVRDYLDGKQPFTRYVGTQGEPDAEAVRPIAEGLTKALLGLVVVGTLRTAAERDAVSALIRRLQWPVITDIGSGLRDPDSLPGLVRHAEGVIRSVSFGAEHRPDQVLHLGGRLVSKHVERYLHAADGCVRVSALPRRLDVQHHLDVRVEADVAVACRRLCESVPQGEASDWTRAWVEAGERAARAVDAFHADAPLSEPMTARLLWGHLPSGHALFLGNSMPIRDMDFMGYGGTGARWVGVNRGASGIDGLVATACGYARGREAPTSLLLGDLSLLHDLNSLSLVARSPQPMLVMVVNNHGGGIFHFLPVARQGDVFEKHFGTPHPYGFEAAAKMFGIPYAAAHSPEAFVAQCENVWESGRSGLVEVVTDRAENHAVHGRILAAVRDAVDLNGADVDHPA